MLPYFDRLGAAVDRAWGAVSREHEAFAQVAAEALALYPPAEQLDLEALTDAALDPDHPVPEPLAGPGAFGQPGLTARRGDGFVVEVYFWAHSRSAIHDHPFQGAFTVVEGFSVHATYDVQIQQQLTARVRLGSIEPRDLELVEPGHVQPFGARHPLVHSLIHVPSPSVSLVVRTVRADDYFRYFPPSVALAMSPPPHGLERALLLLDTLRASAHPSYAARRDAFLAGSDFEAAFRLLSRVLPVADAHERLHLLERVVARHGAQAECIAPSLERAFDAQEAETLRGRLSDPDERLIAIGLQLAADRSSLTRLLEGRFEDPLAALRAFVERPERFAEDEVASRLLSLALVEGRSLAEARAGLAAEFGEEAVAEQDAAILRYWSRSPYACLGR